MSSLALAVTGPTAVGKTDVALAIAEQLPVEIISVDSALVYRGMDIGTAKPSAAEQSVAPHHLIDILDPVEPYSAGRFLADARRLVGEIAARNRIPLFVGGTMLYFRVLEAGIGELPKADPEIRSHLDDDGMRLGWPAMHARLVELDPQAASRIDPQDSQRIQRALEVCLITGEPFSDRQRQQSPGLEIPLKTLAIWPEDRRGLADKIEARFDAMLAAGFLEEVEVLFKRADLSASTPAMRCVGYRQLWSHLAGELSFDDARQAAIVATRQLAKRQTTWLRSMQPDHRLEPAVSVPDGPKGLRSTALAWARTVL